jgi:hypothetical protein
VTVLWIAVAVVFVAAIVGVYVWSRRVESDVDFAAMREPSTQTDAQRRVNQLGIGLTSGPTIGGPQ